MTSSAAIRSACSRISTSRGSAGGSSGGASVTARNHPGNHAKPPRQHRTRSQSATNGHSPQRPTQGPECLRSVRAGGDTKTRKSRRTLELPQRCTDALRLHRDCQDQIRKRAGDRWHDNDLVFASRVGTALWAGNVRRSFRAILTAAGLNSADWTPRELRHSFVSLMSDAGVPIEKIARLVGHTGTTTTETVYRKQIRPVVIGGAEVMDSLFPRRDADA